MTHGCQDWQKFTKPKQFKIADHPHLTGLYLRKEKHHMVTNREEFYLILYSHSSFDTNKVWLGICHPRYFETPYCRQGRRGKIEYQKSLKNEIQLFDILQVLVVTLT